MALSAINWGQVGNDVRTAVMNVLGGAWGTASRAAVPQIEAMITIGQDIARDAGSGALTQSEYDSLKSMEKNALEGILSAYEAVGIVAAEQAATAAWNVLANALRAGGFALIP
jgi:hypothetical protein